MIGITGCALLSLVFARAVVGDLWAIAASVAVGSLVAIVLVHGFFYTIIAGLARVLGSHTLPARTRQGGMQAGPDEQYLPGTESRLS